MHIKSKILIFELTSSTLIRFAKNLIVVYKVFIVVLFFPFVQNMSAQDVEQDDIFLQGVVTNASNEPIQGSMIFVDSVKTGVRTNRKGKFKILLEPDTKYLSAFSWLNGIHTVSYKGETQMTLVFPQNNKAIDESKLVELGYTVKRKPKVRKKKRRKPDYSKYLDVYQMIVAEVPGAQANGRTIALRGNAKNSVLFEAPPLFIVDGTQTSSIDWILPAQIESLEVWRDERTSIYGARGAGGVILINLKK